MVSWTVYKVFLFGFTAPSSDDDGSVDEDLNLMEKQLEAALLKESAAASKEEQDQITGLGKEDGAKISKSFEDELVNTWCKICVIVFNNFIRNSQSL